MSKNEILDKLMSKIKWRECVRDIVINQVLFVVDFDRGNVLGYPSLFQLKVWIYELFNIVYFSSKSQYRISSDNEYIVVGKDYDYYYLKVGKHESKVRFTRSSLQEKN